MSIFGDQNVELLNLTGDLTSDKYGNCRRCGCVINKSICESVKICWNQTACSLLSKPEKGNLAQLRAFAYTCLQ